MKSNYKNLFVLSLLIFPVLALAQVIVPEPGQGFSITILMSGIVTIVWVFFTGLAVIMFIFAGMMFLTSGGDPGKIKSARDAFLWGVVGIIVAILAFSITTIIKSAIIGV
jgi:hypothetical protein